MSVFASGAGLGSGVKLFRMETMERVRGVLEHLSLYIGLAIYTALGAKVNFILIIYREAFKKKLCSSNPILTPPW